MALWDNYDGVAFQVVTNAAGRYSTWPVNRPLPPGWSSAGFSGARQACLEEIGARWHDAPLDEAWPEAAGGARAAGPGALRGPARPVPDTSITALIRAQELPRDRPAVRCGSDELTRGELLDTAAAWARVLAEAGCGPEVPVAVILPRGIGALIAILAVLEAGGAYVPLSCDDPPRRLGASLADCGAAITVTTDELAGRVRPDGGVVLTLSSLKERAGHATAAPRRASSANLAYIFYTSGTAGEPKGVEGTHRQLVNYALWCREAFAHRPGEGTFLSASLFFLGSLTTIFTPLLAGWPIVIAPDGASTDTLLELSGTTTGGLLKLTPTHVRMLTARGVPETGLARQLMVGSEPLTFGRELQQWMGADSGRVVVNHYGLTETHGCFCHWLTGQEEVGGRVPIGRPIDNVEAYIVDRDCELVGPGDVGELLVGGPSIGRGYRRKPMLTAERWIPHPWGDGAALLRTGDLARLEPDGAVTVLGRADRQVKIRGHRVEPAALEEALRGLANVKEALVLPRVDDGAVTLDAYLLRDGGAVDLAEVKDALAASFPPQWIPRRMAVLPEFPVNANGKIDTRALLEPSPVGPALPGPDQDRWSRVDRLVAGAICDVLKIDDIALSDDFYDLGGDSLTAAQVAAQVGRALGKDVPAPAAGAATVRAYARKITGEAA